MLLTLSTTREPGASWPATDLGYVLHKNPARAQTAEVAGGVAHVFYPEATDERCTVALLVDVDPIDLVRRAGPGVKDDFALGHYVNDRPYAASSLLAVALGKVFASARRGVCRERPELVDAVLPLEVHVPALSCRGGASVAERFFAPLGWEVRASPIPLDVSLDWGDSRYVDLRLTGRHRVADALNHLYVGLPVLDDAKHYWVGDDEVAKLGTAGSSWLATHPERELISHRYLAHQGSLARAAIARLAGLDDEDPEDLDPPVPDPGAVSPDTVGPDRAGPDRAGPDRAEPDSADSVPAVPMAVLRREAVLAVLRASGAARVVDLGCGNGALLPALLAEPAFTAVVGVDVSHRALEEAARRLQLDRMPERQRGRLTLLQSALTYTDARLHGYDAAVVMEVIEHLDPDRLPALEHVVFATASPATVVVTTPNVEYNARYEGLAPGARRHRDHRFEWTRREFADWAERVAGRHGYTVTLHGIGPADVRLGASSQMAVFTRRSVPRDDTGVAGARSDEAVLA